MDLLEGLTRPTVEQVERISIQGQLTPRQVKLANGQYIPVVETRLTRGLYGWSTERLLRAALSGSGVEDEERLTTALRGFLNRVYYDLRNELRIAEWQAQGMKEIAFPLPGRRDLMVCALEIVATRGSGGCRLVQPGDPELAAIGDARDVVNVMRIYRRGELIWRGPGVYR